MSDAEPRAPPREKPPPNLAERLSALEEAIEAVDPRATPDASTPRGASAAVAADPAMRALLDSVNEGALLLARDGSVIYANPRAVETLSGGAPPQAGKGPIELPPEARAAIAPALAGSAPVLRREAELHTPDGSSSRVRLTATALPPPGLARVVVALTELDEARDSRRRLEQRLGERAREAADAHEALETFAYAVSHDLRAPLRAIDGFLGDVEAESDRLSEAASASLARVRRATQQADALMEALLRLSRVGRVTMEKRLVDFTAIADSVARRLAQASPERRASVRVERGLLAWADEGLARTLLDCLLENAWKFTSAKPTATIEVGREPTEIGPVFHVRDDGAGFDPAHASRLFAPFQRLHAPTEFPGVGIGLAIANRVVSRHGGRIWAEGRPGEGATVYFVLPGEAT